MKKKERITKNRRKRTGMICVEGAVPNKRTEYRMCLNKIITSTTTSAVSVIDYLVETQLATAEAYRM